MRDCCGMLLVFLASTVARSEDVPRLGKAVGDTGPFKELAGGWVRPPVTYDGKTYLPMHWTKDGNVVYPGLQLVAQGKNRRLFVGGSPPLVYWNPGPESYDLEVGEGKDRGMLVIQVGVRKLRFKYAVEKDTLTISGTQKVPAGYWLGDYNISGTWVRPKREYLK